MGANMQRQAVPLVRSEAPFVGTGMERAAAVDAGDVVIAKKAGVVTEVSAELVVMINDDGTETNYRINKFARSNQGNCYNHRVLVSEGQRLEVGGIIADGPATDQGELALGKNLLVAFMSWEGHNFEDAIILSQRIVAEDVLSSIHIEEHEIDARDTKLVPRKSLVISPTCPRKSLQAWTSVASSTSVQRLKPATSWSERSPPLRVKPS